MFKDCTHIETSDLEGQRVILEEYEQSPYKTIVATSFVTAFITCWFEFLVLYPVLTVDSLWERFGGYVLSPWVIIAIIPVFVIGLGVPSLINRNKINELESIKHELQTRQIASEE